MSRRYVHTCIRVRDPEASVRFYRALGFEPRGRLNFETAYFVLTSDYLTYANKNQAVNLAVLRRFATEKIDFAFPTRTIVVRGAAPGVVAAPA